MKDVFENCAHGWIGLRVAIRFETRRRRCFGDVEKCEHRLIFFFVDLEIVQSVTLRCAAQEVRNAMRAIS